MTQLTRVRAWAPGTCGELVEGAIGVQPFLITCPIDIGSTMEIFIEDREPSGSAYPKTVQALKLAAEKWGFAAPALGFERESLLPPGKGMGSSTADIAAAVQAAARLFSVDVSPDQIAELALEIEPTDGLMYPGIMLFDHRWGKLREHLGDPPPLNILILDPGGAVDTLDFNQDEKLNLLNQKKEPQVKKALRLVKEGIRQQDIDKLGRGATESALANQELLSKPDLPQVLKWAEDLGAVGVNIAHSGTVMGLLLPPDGNHPEELIPYLKKKRSAWKFYTAKLTGGGLK